MKYNKQMFLASFLLVLPTGLLLHAQEMITRHRMIPFERGGDVALADFNNDSLADLLLGRGGELSVALNDGTGRFIQAPLADGFDCTLFTRKPTAGRFSGSSNMDAVCWGSGGVLRGFAGDGLGALAEVTVSAPSTMSPLPGAIFPADIDGDGLQDLFVLDSGNLVLWRNQGNWTFAVSPLPASAGIVSDIALADIDADGDMDYVSAGGNNPGSDTVNQLFLNDGSGVFAAVDTALDDVAHSTDCTTFVDFDGDGDLDVYFGNQVFFGSGDPIHQIFRNDGGLVFVDQSSSIPAAADFTFAIDSAAADLDGDGQEEVLFLQNDSPIEVFSFLSGTGAFQRSTIQVAEFGWTPSALLVGDIDADSDIDLIVANLRAPRLYANKGDGTLTSVEPEGGLFLGLPTANAAFDADLDGDLDVLIVMSTVDAELLAGDIEGELTSGQAQLPTYLQGSSDVAVGDLDSDGDEDVVLTDTLRVMENIGALAFVDAPARISGSSVFGLGLELGDYDGDGDLDLLSGIRFSGGTKFYRNDGLGVLVEEATAVQNSNSLIVTISAGDLDADGDLDAVLGSDNTTQTELLINNGGAAFTASVGPFPFDANWTSDAELFDADADGDLDVYFAKRGGLMGTNNVSALDTFFLNDGVAGFTEAPSAISSALNTTGAVVSLDLDQDGDLDLALLEADSIDYPTCTQSKARVRLLLNDGSGTLLEESSISGGSVLLGGALCCADMDADGDGDLVCEDRVIVNVLAQLHRANLPRLGKRLDFEGFGPSDGQILLAASLGSASLPLGSLGTLRLDPSSAILVGSALLDSDGHATYSLQVPSSPSLLGFTSFWQALVTAPARLTNAERVTLSDL